LQAKPYFWDVRAANVLGDERLEIIAGGAGGNAEIIVVLDAESGSLAAPEPPGELRLRSFEPYDLNEDGHHELIVSRDDGVLAAYHPEDQTFSPPIASFDPPVLTHRLADVTRDGIVDIVITQPEVGLSVFDGSIGEIVWTSPWLGHLPGLRGALWIANTDAEPLLEIVVGLPSGLAVFEAPLSVLFRSGFETGDTSEWSTSQP
jgi:hypothetical protein